jgi:hypothetical protein
MVDIGLFQRLLMGRPSGRHGICGDSGFGAMRVKRLSRAPYINAALNAVFKPNT